MGWEDLSPSLSLLSALIYIWTHYRDTKLVFIHLEEMKKMDNCNFITVFLSECNTFFEACLIFGKDSQIVFTVLCHGTKSTSNPIQSLLECLIQYFQTVYFQYGDFTLESSVNINSFRNVLVTAIVLVFPFNSRVHSLLVGHGKLIISNC